MSDAFLSQTITISAGGDEIEAYAALVQDEAPRGGVVVIHHLPGYDEETKEIVRHFGALGYNAIMPNVDRSSWLMTDEFVGYNRLGTQFAAHSRLSHKREEYVRGGGFSVELRIFKVQARRNSAASRAHARRCTRIVAKRLHCDRSRRNRRRCPRNVVEVEEVQQVRLHCVARSKVRVGADESVFYKLDNRRMVHRDM